MELNTKAVKGNENHAGLQVSLRQRGIYKHYQKGRLESSLGVLTMAALSDWDVSEKH